MTDPFHRYLRAKRAVDDRSLDRRLVDDLREQLTARTAGTGPLRVLEVGCGIGTMITRFLEWNIFPPGTIQYTAVDIDSENIAELPAYLGSWAECRSIAVADSDPLTLLGRDRRIEIEPRAADAVEYARGADPEYDLVVGAAVLDLLDLSGLEPLLETLTAGGLYYFPITFDGVTRFLPAHSADRAIQHHYHAHMDDKPGGNSRAGSDALFRLQRLSGVTVDAAGSDWIVTSEDGPSPGDEAYFLRYILDCIEEAVAAQTGPSFEPLDDWMTRREAQLAAGELVYIAHQLDLLGRFEEPAAVGQDSE